MATLLIVLLMAFNMWMVIYLNPREERKGRREQDGGFRDRGQKPLQDAGNEATDCHTCAKCRHGNTK